MLSGSEPTTRRNPEMRPAKYLPLCPPVAYNNIERLTFQKAPLVDADRFYIQNAPNLFIEEFLDTLRSGVQIEESITQVCAHPS